jgi:hypothetical protein
MLVSDSITPHRVIQNAGAVFPNFFRCLRGCAKIAHRHSGMDCRNGGDGLGVLKNHD